MKPHEETWEHISGAWPEEVLVKREDRYYKVCEVWAGGSDYLHETADLIAAAPEMYRLLKDCLYVFENVVDMEAGNPRGGKRVGELMTRIEEILKKAEASNE